MKDKILKIMEYLNKGLVDKEDIMKAGLLTLLAKENIILLGPPGTAKSEIARRLSNVIKGGNYFEYLLTKFTTPEELFGPLSIKSLKNDEFHRNTQGYLPDSNVVFLDEIFKANSSILNSLLTIINEKKYHNGREKMDVSLVSLVGASNEYPGSEELEALYDRFLIKKKVGYISGEKRNELFELTGENGLIPEELKITVEEIEEIQKEYQKVKLPKEIINIVLNIADMYIEELKDNKKERISDRKLVKLSKLLKISAYTNGREEVNLSDVFLLKECLWNDYENGERIEAIIRSEVSRGKIVDFSS